MPSPNRGPGEGLRRQELRNNFDHVVAQLQHEYPDELERCFLLLLDLTGRRAKHEKCKTWMVKRVEKAPYLTSVRVAAEARYYFRMPMSMMPWLIQTARNAKACIRMRVLRTRLKDDRALAHREEAEAQADMEQERGER